MVKEELENEFTNSEREMEHEEQNELNHIDEMEKTPEKSLEDSSRISTAGMSAAERYLKEQREDKLRNDIEEKESQKQVNFQFSSPSN